MKSEFASSVNSGSERQTELAQVFTLFRGLPWSPRHLDLVAPVAKSLPEALPGLRR